MLCDGTKPAKGHSKARSLMEAALEGGISGVYLVRGSARASDPASLILIFPFRMWLPKDTPTAIFAGGAWSVTAIGEGPPLICYIQSFE